MTRAALIYSGTFERVIDLKNRITVPAAWMDSEQKNFQAIVSPNQDCLLIMPSGEFATIEEKILNSEASPQEKRKAIRQFYSRAKPLSLDSQGRLLLAEEQCRVLDLRGGVLLVGSRSRFEIWNKEKWGQLQEEEDQSFQKVASLIGL